MSRFRSNGAVAARLINARLSRRTAVQAGAALVRPPLSVAGAAQEVPTYDGKEVTISYGFWDTKQQAAVEAQIAAFNELYPNITVEPQIVPWEDYWTKLQTGVAGGETFDVF